MYSSSAVLFAAWRNLALLGYCGRSSFFFLSTRRSLFFLCVCMCVCVCGLISELGPGSWYFSRSRNAAFPFCVCVCAGRCRGKRGWRSRLGKRGSAEYSSAKPARKLVPRVDRPALGRVERKLLAIGFFCGILLLLKSISFYFPLLWPTLLNSLHVKSLSACHFLLILNISPCTTGP